jgi:hypothetical protein
MWEICVRILCKYFLFSYKFSETCAVEQVALHLVEWSVLFLNPENLNISTNFSKTQIKKAGAVMVGVLHTDGRTNIAYILQLFVTDVPENKW